MSDDTNADKELQKLNFIPDEVASQDAFKSHSRIAAAIAFIIRTKRNLKVIGLLGTWGSGKSTVVKFVRDRLEVDDKAEQFYCFTYDAWMHQNDPPRRAFLETLIGFLIKYDLTTDKKWEVRLKELNRQIEESESTSTPTLSAAGKWLLPSALAVPLGMSLIGHDWFKALSEKGASPFEKWAFYLGAVFVVFPALVAMGLTYWWRPTRNPFGRAFWSSDNWKANRKGFENESILSIFTNREIAIQKNRTTRSPDPTTIEFQEIFREILLAVPNKDKNGREPRLIFVVDNLDRLPEAEAIEMWTTIRSFFLGSEQGLTLPTVILPIDEKAVQRMYAVKNPDAEIAGPLAKSFMDKTFDLTFHVTPPVLSNWRAFMQDRLKFMFGSIMEPSWPYELGGIFDKWLLEQRDTQAVTPRNINTLLNLIGSIWLQWNQSDISFAAICYYCVRREKIDANIFAAVQIENPGIEVFDADWQTAISALHFGVDPTEAAQVLLEQPLRKALLEGNELEFIRCAAVPGFAYVFDRMLQTQSTSPDSIPIGTAIVFYDRRNLSADSSITDVSTLAAWRQLRTGWLKNTEIKDVASVDAKIIDALVRHCVAADLPAFLNGAAAQLSRVPEAALSSGCAAWLDSARAIVKSAKGVAGVTPKFVMQGDPTIYISAVALCAGEPDLVRCLASNATSAKIVAALAQNLGIAGKAQGIDATVGALLSVGAKLPWEPVVEAAAAKLEAARDDGTSASANCLGLLRASPNEAKAKIQLLIDSGQLVSRFHESMSEGDRSGAAAIAALILMSSNPSVLTLADGSTWATSVSAQGELVPLVGEKLVAFGGPADMLGYATLAANFNPVAPLVRAIASARFKAGKLPLPRAEEMVDQFTTFAACLEPELAVPFVCGVADNPEFWAKLNGVSLMASQPLLYCLIEEQSTAREQGARTIADKLQAVPNAAWQSAVDAGGEPFGLAMALKNFDEHAEVSGNLLEVLRAKIPELVSNDNQAVRGRWLKLVGLLNTNARKTLFKIVGDHVCQPGIAAKIQELLSMDNGVLLSEGELDRHADGAAAYVILPQLSDTGGISWLVANAEGMATIVDKSSEELRATIGARLLEMWRGTDSGEAKGQFEELGRAWKFPHFEAEPKPQFGSADETQIAS